jgi:hypothetical protein
VIHVTAWRGSEKKKKTMQTKWENLLTAFSWRRNAFNIHEMHFAIASTSRFFFDSDSPRAVKDHPVGCDAQ